MSATRPGCLVGPETAGDEEKNSSDFSEAECKGGLVANGGRNKTKK